MNYLYILGASGSGKTTLAKKLDAKFPDIFHRVIQHTTRQKREDEKHGEDYYYIGESEYDRYNFFEKVETQYAPAGRYGGSYNALQEGRINLVVACIEGLFSGIKNSFNEKIMILNIICDGKSFVEREGRNISYEEKFNKAAIYPFLDPESPSIVRLNEDDCNEITYFELSIDDLRNMSEDALKRWIIERFYKECLQ